jgi:RND superfamily putative drug exporter
VDKRPVTVRVARWSATHPWRAMGLWIAFVALCFAVGNMVGLNEADDNGGDIGEASRAVSLYDERRRPTTR